MKALVILILLACLTPLLVAQTPTVAGLENNYSFAPPGSPGYGIAEGSIFDIFGSNLANTSTGLQSPPPTSLQGVTVSITVNGVTRLAPLYYVTPKQIGAILPSDIPVGTGTITVNNTGTMSTPAPIIVVQSAFGVLTLNNGTGPAAAFNSSYQYLGASNAANPGDVILLWGTGLGPVPNDLQQSAVATPPEIDIGGIPAKIWYAGRSQYPGLDQINVEVPAGVSGCYVSVVVRNGSTVSNFASIPVAASGRTCSDATTGLGFSVAQLQSLVGKTSVTVGGLGLAKINISTPAVVVGGVTVSPASTTVIDSGFAAFEKVTLPAQFDPYTAAAASNTIASVGNCYVYTTTVDTSSPPPTSTTPTPSTPVPTITTTPLNAGPFINVTGPLGSKQMPFNNGAYGGQLGGGVGSSALPAFIPDAGGAFAFDNGSGGPDIGPFHTTLNFNAAVWTNPNLTSVTRSQGLPITWTGGDASTYVEISGTSFTSTGTLFTTGVFTCVAPATAHQFTVPSSVLLALPASGTETIGSISIPLAGGLSVMSYAWTNGLYIPGVDLTYGYTYSIVSTAVTYQ
jgi:uncharacterized protein (TIGR03437 family)